MLLVDVGNTNIKWILHADLCTGQTAQCHVCEPNQLATMLDAKWGRLSPPTRVVIGSVAAEATNRALSDWVRTHWGITPEWIKTAAAAAGVINGYHEPRQLGVDRWAALVAAHHLVDGAKCVVDLGTALTCDVLCGDGRHCGGVISPGRSLMLSSLAQAAEAINFSETEVESMTLGLGKTTAAGMHYGACAALAGAIDHACKRANSLCDAPVTILLSGGDAGYLLPWLRSAALKHEPELVLKGLALLAENEATQVDLGSI